MVSSMSLVWDLPVCVLYVCRLVVDEWLELKFPDSERGQLVLSAVQTLRSTWTHLLEMKLQPSQSWYQYCVAGDQSVVFILSNKLSLVYCHCIACCIIK